MPDARLPIPDERDHRAPRPSPDVAEGARRAAAHVFVADIADPVLDDDDAHHLLRVLRLRPGEAISTSDGRGSWRLCRLGATPGGGSASGALELDGNLVVTEAALPPVVVGLALTKGERPEWAVQKLTEIGVDRVMPLMAARSVVRWDASRAERHLTRWRQVARQAAMQSRRLHLPVIDAPIGFADALERFDPLVLAAPGGDALDLSRSTVLVGPEGGWSPAEEASAPGTVDLGPGILRTETAAIVAAAILCALRHRAGVFSPP